MSPHQHREQLCRPDCTCPNKRQDVCGSRDNSGRDNAFSVEEDLTGPACSEHMSDGEVLVQADLRVQPHTSVFLDGASRYQEQPRIIGSPLAMGVDAIAALVALCVFKKWAQPRFLACKQA